MEKAVEETRKRKIRLDDDLESELELELDDASSSVAQLKNPRLELEIENLDLPAAVDEMNCENCVNSDSDHVEAASCCSSDDASSNFVDLEETPEFSTTSAGAGDSSNCRKRRETTPSSRRIQRRPNSGELNSNSTPSQAELEEFFSMAETNLHQQFITKYNFDIVKDQPLDGRYEWLPI